MKPGRWLLIAILPSLTALLMVSSAFSAGQSAVIFDYEVTNDGGILFADEYERLGGVDTLGHPASYRFKLGDGFTYQVTQRALLQWRPEKNAADLGNIFQMLEQAGLDDWLLREKGIPLPIKDGAAGIFRGTHALDADAAVKHSIAHSKAEHTLSDNTPANIIPF